MKKFKKPLIIIGIIVLALIALKVIIKPTYSTWEDSADESFDGATDVTKVLQSKLPNRNFYIRRYKTHSTPELVNSLFVRYEDTDLDKSFKRYVNKETLTGEFVDMGMALCNAEDVRKKLGYNVITFRVRTGDDGLNLYYENWVKCGPIPEHTSAENSAN